MSSYKIIQLSNKPVSEEEHITDRDIYEDALFLMESDWGGDTLEYGETIDSIAEDLKQIADIDKEKRTLTFKDKETIKTILRDHVRRCCDRFMERTEEGRWSTSEMELRHEIVEPCGIKHHFHIGCSQKMSTVLADYIAGYNPQTMHIGAILYAHF